MKEASKAQIKEWKEKYGVIYELVAVDGKKAYIKDPLNHLNVVKQAFAALNDQGTIGMAVACLNNCWIDGDPEIKTIESYANDLADQIGQVFKMPDFEVIPNDTGYTIKSEGEVINVRSAERTDIISAEQRNSDSIPFQTSEYILETIAIDKNQLSELKHKNGKAYLGMIRAVKQVKDKIHVSVKKL